jgi:ubiquinone/menaquinone biosynthesis C-methylase UbiE
MSRAYVHGYDPRESQRLNDQAGALADLLHSDTTFPAGSRVLEVGCGVGAQTLTLAGNSPGARIVAIDVSSASLEEARARARAAHLSNVEFRCANLFDPPFKNESFDHVFVCFVLEHLSEPAEAVRSLRGMLRSAGTITVIEGDHGSAYFHPDDDAAHDAIGALIELQRRSGGDATIGRRLYPLLAKAGFRDVRVSPRMVCVDSSKPHLVEGFTKRTFTAMIEGVREQAIGARLIDAERFDTGIRALYRTAADDGVFCYTFFKAVGTKTT